MPRDMQASFVGGEITPALHSRVDIEKYHNALSRVKNFFIHAQGGVSNRAGTEFVGECRSGINRIIPFQFNTEQAYALVFSDNNLRVIRNGGYVVESAQNITNITAANPAVITVATHGYSNGDTVYLSGTGVAALDNKYFVISNSTASTFEVSADGTGWSSGGTAERLFELLVGWNQDELFDLIYTQSADVMTVNHPDYVPVEITRTAHDNWTDTPITVGSTTSAPTNIRINDIGTPSGSNNRNYRYVITAVDSNGIESVQSDIVSTNYLDATSYTITGITTATPAVVTTSAAHGYNNGDTVFIDNVVGKTEVNGRYFRIANVTATTFELEDTFGGTYSAYVSGGTVQKEFGAINALSQTYGNQLSWDAVAGASYYNIYKENAQNSNIFGWIGETEGAETLFTDFNFSPDLSVTPPLNYNPFNGNGNKPRCSSYFQQRLFYASSINNPQTVWASKSSQFQNFDYSRPLRADDSIQFTVNDRQVNEIRHLVSMGDLVAFTSGSAFKLGADEDGVITPSNINPTRQGGYGASKVRPIVIGESALYVQEKGGKVRDLGYVFESNKYTGSDLSIMAEHLFRGKEIVDWCYCEEPYGIVWVVLNEGTLLSLTYLKEHKVWGWSQHETDGDVESVCSVSEGDEDILYLVVKRTINGSEVRYIERMKERNFATVDDWFFVDCGLTFTGSSFSITGATQADPIVITATGHDFDNGDAVRITGVVGMTEINTFLFRVANKTANTFELQDLDGNDIDGTGYTAYTSGGTVQFAAETLTGLDHLEAKSVVALADGNVDDNDLTVSSGSVSLTTPACVVHVGLQYTAEIETLNIDFPGQPTVQSRKKAVSRLAVRVRDTRGLKSGINENKLYETKERDVSMGYGNIPAKTGEQIFELGGTWTNGGQVLIRQDNPLAATILAVIPEIDISG